MCLHSVALNRGIYNLIFWTPQLLFGQTFVISKNSFPVASLYLERGEWEQISLAFQPLPFPDPFQFFLKNLTEDFAPPAILKEAADTWFEHFPIQMR